MKVHELISALNSCNPDADVIMPDGLDIYVATNDDGSQVYLCDDEPVPCIGCGGCGCHGDCQR